MTEEDQIILVDEKDQEIGSMGKLEAHEKGLLHRAFSILIFNNKGEFLIHKRAEGKYHSFGLWTNTCCSHPKAGESLEVATHRRLQEEMGFDCTLNFAYKFTYKTTFSNNLVEHELDHVFLGEYNGDFKPDPAEVSECRWVKIGDLRKEMKESPDNFTFWFKLIIQEHLKGFQFPKK